MANVEDTIKSIKDKLPDITPTPPALHAHANVHELKSRLEWGEPAMTIFDVRDPAAFQTCRIMGAMCLSVESLQQGEKPSLEAQRDIYIYGETDEETVTAANLMRGLGFTHVAELLGGLQAWRAIGGTVEGLATEQPTRDADEFNIFSRLKKFSEEKSREDMLKTQ